MIERLRVRITSSHFKYDNLDYYTVEADCTTQMDDILRVLKNTYGFKPVQLQEVLQRSKEEFPGRFLRVSVDSSDRIVGAPSLGTLHDMKALMETLDYCHRGNYNINITKTLEITYD